MDLPRCAILLNEETNKEIPIIIIQAEQFEDKIYIGFRFMKGGNGICTVDEIALLDEPNERFF
jgi:hypothetical protein